VRHLLAYEGQVTIRRPGKIWPIAECGAGAIKPLAQARLKPSRNPRQPTRGRDTPWLCSHRHQPKSGTQVARPSTKDACEGVWIDAREQEPLLDRRNRRER